MFDDNLLRIYRTAKAMRECALGWEGNARLLGNVKAEDIAEASEYLIDKLTDEDPLLIFDGVSYRFWTCPNGCRGGVSWSDDGVATCEACFRASNDKE